MPHVALKMLSGRDEQTKERLAAALQNTVTDVLGCDAKWVSVSVEDYSAEQWQEIFREQVTENANLRIKPQYDPKSLL